MSNRPWHKRYHSDALTGYQMLSLEERGAYTTLLDMMYDRGEALHISDRLLAGYLGVSVRKSTAIVEALISMGKIIRLEDGRLTNSRFEKERENALKTSRKRAENELKTKDKSGETEKTINENNVADEKTKEKQSDISDTRSQKPEIDRQDDLRARDFDAFDMALRKIPGIASHPVAVNPVIAPIWQLSLKGYDLKSQISPSIARQIGATRRSVTSWGYFVSGIIADAQAPPIAPPSIIPTGAANGTYQQKPSRRQNLAMVDAAIAELERREAEGGS